MKKWPEELENIVPDSETVSDDGNFGFSWRCEISLNQREAIRKFLFGLGKDEFFEYTHPELDTSFSVRLDGQTNLRASTNWGSDESSEKTYELSLAVTTSARKETFPF